MRLLLPLLPALLALACGKSDPPPAKENSAPPVSPESANNSKPDDQDSAPAKSKPVKKPKRKRRAQLERERRTYVAELAQLDTNIEGVRELLAKRPTNRMNLERLAAMSMQRARLSGSYDDYQHAEDAIEKAFGLTPVASTYLLRAKLHYTLHRLLGARSDFEQAKPLMRGSPGEVAAAEAFEGNLALQAGDAKAAAKRFGASLAAKRTTGNLGSMAVYRWKTGEFEKAEELLLEVLKSYHGKPMEPRAWIHLNLGLLDLDRGRYDDALAHYREAETFMKGYWLIDEHIAEILTLQGKTEEAKALYLDIIERTNNPEFMDAMAGIAFEAGKDDEGKKWVSRARARYDEQMAKYPEAAYGHALGHFLEFGDDPAKVLELAQKNYDLRPNLEASVMLAQAHLKAGDAKAAQKALKPILKSKFESAELYVTAAEVQAALGKQKKAASFIEKAKAIDPTSSLEHDAAEDEHPDPAQ